jgi:hypothetical protein
MKRSICIILWSLGAFVLTLLWVAFALELIVQFDEAMPRLARIRAYVPVPAESILLPFPAAILLLWLGIKGGLPGTRKVPPSS